MRSSKSNNIENSWQNYCTQRKYIVDELRILFVMNVKFLFWYLQCCYISVQRFVCNKMNQHFYLESYKSVVNAFITHRTVLYCRIVCSEITFITISLKALRITFLKCEHLS